VLLVVKYLNIVHLIATFLYKMVGVNFCPLQLFLCKISHTHSKLNFAQRQPSTCTVILLYN